MYQHYLPPAERQRLGGFYTPDELIDLVLDLAEYLPASEGLCELSFLDPACGSGAFVANALARLLRHLSLDLPCHAHLHKPRVPEWKRAEAVLELVARNLHGVDLHPFAAFLTTVNVLFLLLPTYAKAREKTRIIPSISRCFRRIHWRNTTAICASRTCSQNSIPGYNSPKTRFIVTRKC